MIDQTLMRIAGLRHVSTLMLVVLLLAGCSKPSKNAATSDAEATSSKGESDTATTPEERRYLAAAKPFAVAIAAGKYEQAYGLLSSYATASMSLNQFAPEDDEAKFAEREKNPVKAVTVEKFRELMGRAEARHGTPRSVKSLSVFSTDPKALDRRGKERLDAVDAMFAVGMMPDSIPAEIRRASVRGKVLTQFSAQELEKIAKEENMTVADLQESPDFEPYLTIKIVLVEEAGQLKVGYFEFLPPGIMD
ncbi:MAG TPA: hypothetical protein VLZ12_13170 [Verrucomicrobiae bacterium]|nr:hypothetical protein [Verrucomicrobiae bacterium]